MFSRLGGACDILEGMSRYWERAELNQLQHVYRIALCVIISSAVAGCATSRTESQYDRRVDFSAFRTFAWHESSAIDIQGDIRNPEEIRERLAGSISSALRAKAFAPTPGSPDFLVRYTARVDARATVPNRSDLGASTSGGFDTESGSGAAVTGRDVTETGTLTIEMVDPTSNRTLWRGTSRAEVVTYMRAMRNEDELDAFVAQTLDGFPPR